jgi:hypothetical protein
MAVLFTVVLHAQDIREELIMKDTLADTSAYKVENVVFDKAGNYCISYEHHKLFYYLTKEKLYGPFNFHAMDEHERTEHSYSGLSYEKGNDLHYKVINGVEVYPSSGGRFAHAEVSGGGNLAVILEDSTRSIYTFYVNGKNTGITTEKYPSYAFQAGASGHYMLHIEDGPDKGLYLDGTRIDTTGDDIDSFDLDSAGNYLYLKDNGEEHVDVRVHYEGRDTLYVFVPAHSGLVHAGFMEGGGYYVQVNRTEHAGPRIIFNGGRELHFGREAWIRDSWLTAADDYAVIYSHNRESHDSLLVNGRCYYNPVGEDVNYLVWNKAGDLSFATKNYGSIVNWGGGEHVMRMGHGPDFKSNSRYRRFNLIYMSPRGDTMLYKYVQAHTVFIKRNEELLFILPEDKFGASWQDFYDRDGEEGYIHARAKRWVDQDCFINVDTLAYFIYRGNISRPFRNIYLMNEAGKGKSPNYYYSPRFGISNNIVSCKTGKEGFYIIQYQENGRYMIDINNRQYYTLDNIDVVYPYNVYFDGKELIFYLHKNGSYYRYTIKIN